MSYFSKVKIEQEVFSLIYGKGIVNFALPKKHRVDGFYIFAVEYKKKKVVHYTVDGFPNWSTENGLCQTVFYKEDLDFMDVDMKPVKKILSEKKIIKLKEKGTLELQCPSGIWRNADEVPQKIFKDALKNSQLNIFREEKE